jgi:hypothetical protein
MTRDGERLRRAVESLALPSQAKRCKAKTFYVLPAKPA